MHLPPPDDLFWMIIMEIEMIISLQDFRFWNKSNAKEHENCYWVDEEDLPHLW